MLAIDDDMRVFFNADFASTWVRLAGAECAAVQFPAIHGVQDVEALQGYALGAEHELAYITNDVDLQEGQRMQQLGNTAIWRCKAEPVRGADGRSSTVLLAKVSE